MFAKQDPLISASGLSKSPKAIFFDAAGTLIHLPKGVGWHYRDVAARHGLNLAEEALNRAFRAAWKRSVPPAESRVRRPDDDKGWWRALVGEVLADCAAGVPGLAVDACFEELYAEFARPGLWEVYPDVEKTLAALARRFPLHIVSNFDGRLRAVLDDLGLSHFFQHWIISSEVGADKPSPWIYERALTLAGVAAGEALHVGDDPVCDWEGAAAAGLQVFRLDRPRMGLDALVAQLDG